MIFSGGAAAAAEQQKWQARAALNAIRIAHCIYIRMYKSEREWACACECQTMHAHFGTAQFQ